MHLVVLGNISIIGCLLLRRGKPPARIRNEWTAPGADNHLSIIGAIKILRPHSRARTRNAPFANRGVTSARSRERETIVIRQQDAQDAMTFLRCVVALLVGPARSARLLFAR